MYVAITEYVWIIVHNRNAPIIFGLLGPTYGLWGLSFIAESCLAVRFVVALITLNIMLSLKVYLYVMFLYYVTKYFLVFYSSFCLYCCIYWFLCAFCPYSLIAHCRICVCHGFWVYNFVSEYFVLFLYILTYFVVIFTFI